MTTYELRDSENLPIQINSEVASTESARMFEAAIVQVKNFALREFDREIGEHRLYYHTIEHIRGVQRRAKIIFDAVRPSWEASLESTDAANYMMRMQHLLDLCAIAHDMIQIFVPQTQPHSSRRREAGVSERATIDRLLTYIHDLNQQCEAFTEADLTIIQDAIKATICAYDPIEQSIYQPVVYDFTQAISPIARMIALADISALGMEGIAAYNQEGSLLLLEENLDIIPLISQGIATSESTNSELLENLRQRLLKRARFQVSFAKSRLSRNFLEISSFPEAAIPTLANQVFQFLNEDTIREIELMTPTQEDTSLETLIAFFKLEQFVHSLSA